MMMLSITVPQTGGWGKGYQASTGRRRPERL